MHGLLHIGWVHDDHGNGFHAQMAVLVKPAGRLGTAYMAAIRPVRLGLVYPLLRRHRVSDEEIEHSHGRAIAWVELGDDPPRYLVGDSRDGASTQHSARAVRGGKLMSERTYGRTKTGAAITDEMIEEMVDEAERGYEPGQLRGRRRGPGRPPLGEAAKSVESVRLEPGLRAETARRAAAEGVTVSEVIRRALRQYLQTPASQ